jgi:hypothetical protein
VTLAIDHWTVYDRLIAVLSGRQPDRIPFIDRLKIWHRAHKRAGTLPVEYEGMTLNEIHRAVGMGHMDFLPPNALRLRNVEVRVDFEGDIVYHETDPVVDSFPNMDTLAVQDRAGVTSIQLVTPVGKLGVQYKILPSMVLSGTDAYIQTHLIKSEEDFQTVEYIIERAEFVPDFERIYQEQDRLGKSGYIVPRLRRIPFQQALLEYLGETPLFYALYDTPHLVRRLIQVLDQQMVDTLQRLADFDWLYVEFPDNLDGLMTNPSLFAEYCLPAYQRYADILHGQGKKVGSHTDGNLKPLLKLLAKSGLDVCESISPAPLTPCTFEEIWQAWGKGPIIWGGLPSPILEERTGEREFREYVQNVLEIVGQSPIILGISDMVLVNNSIERVRYIAGQVENWPYS